MRTLTSQEIVMVDGGSLDSLEIVSAAAGALCGASLGFSITAPIAYVGAVFALVPQGGIITEGLLLSGAILGAGVIGGSLLGGAIGWGIGATINYIVG